MKSFKVGNVVKLLLWTGVVIWLAQLGTAAVADRHYAKGEKRTLEYAHKKELVADSLQAVADSLVKQRDSLAISSRVRTIYVREQVEALPPAVTPSDSLRDRIIATQDSVITDLHSVIAKSQEIEAALRGALANQKARGDSLVAWIQQPKKKPSRWGIGASVGQCIGVTFNSPCVSVGVQYKVL